MDQTTTPTTTPETKPTPVQSRQIDHSNIQESFINPSRPDFSKEAVKKHLSLNEYLEGEKPSEIQANDQEHSGENELGDGEGVQGNTQEKKEGENEGEKHPLQDNAKDVRSRRVAEHLSQLAKKESELRRLKKEFDEAKAANPNLTIDDLKKRAAEDPFSVLEELGTNYNDLTRKIITGKDSEEKRMLTQALERVERLEREIEEKKKFEEQSRIKTEYETAKVNLQNHLMSQPEKYELINATKGYETVFELMRQYFGETQQMLSFDDAADIVENELEKNERSRIEALLKTNKAKNWGLSSSSQGESQVNVDSSQNEKAQVASPQQAVEKPVVHPQTSKTITGQMVGSSTGRPRRRLTRDESVAEAARLIRFNQ
jgi:hypothetical protein